MKYDNDAIAADLQNTDMSSKDIAAKYGCSYGLVLTIKRKLDAGLEPTDKTPLNVRRAITLRTRAQSFQSDFDVLKRWLPNDVDNRVSDLIVTLEEAVEKITLAADLFEALPEECVVRRRSSSSRKIGASDDLPEGTLVRLSKKCRDTYTGLVESPDALRVVTVRDRSVLVVDESSGTKLFIPRKDLRLADDDGEDDDSGEE